SRGDRLFLVSDGVTECPDLSGTELGTEGLVAILQQNSALDSPLLLEALVWDLNSFAGGMDLPDDVSGLIFDYRG
ncbi:MAG: SpoIIE family protein phosphatase, partial [Cypionkella sp.]